MEQKCFFLLWFNIDIGIVKFIELILKTLFCLYQDTLTLLLTIEINTTMERVEVNGMIAEIGIYSIMFLSLFKESFFIIFRFYLDNHRIVFKVIFFNFEPWIFAIQ